MSLRAVSCRLLKKADKLAFADSAADRAGARGPILAQILSELRFLLLCSSVSATARRTFVCICT